MMATMGTLAAMGLGGMAASAAGAPDPAAGKQAFVPCQGCHSAAQGDEGAGPSLFHVAGRKVASEPGFDYSPAMKAKGGIWSDAALDAYLADPRKAVPGTTMTYPGQKDPAKRAALIAYLKSLK
jgi:cytochrome c